MSAPTVTHCIHDHAFTDENTYWVQGPNGPQRQCRECRRIRSRKYEARRRVGKQLTDAEREINTQRATPVPVGDWVTRGACRNAQVDDFFPHETERGLP